MATPREQWLEARSRLRDGYERLSEEVRAYPSPIARCDDQLPGLIERRSILHGELTRADAQPPDGLSDAEYLALAAQCRAALDRAQR